jgi:hypothetical protein
MRNAVIRKKRLRAERIVDDFMRMPPRIVLGVNASDLDTIDWASPQYQHRLTAI